MARVTVMGGGIFGLACAFELARRGASVRLVERQAIGAGASGGHVGALAPHVPENWNDKKQFQLESLLMAGPFWAAVQAIGGLDPLFSQTGRIQPVADAAALAGRIEASALRWPAPMAITDAPAGLVPASGSGLWLTDRLSARLAPRAALAALAAALRALGTEIETGAAPPAGGAVLWATGHEGLAELGAGRGIKGQSALLRHAAGEAAQVYAGGLHIVPHGDGTVAVGSTTEPEAVSAGPDAGALALVDRARAICPVLADAPVIETWAGMRPRARSRAPVLGPWPGRPGHFVANGGFKIGFGMAPKIAAVMADLILTGRDAIPAGFRLQGASDTPVT